MTDEESVAYGVNLAKAWHVLGQAGLPNSARVPTVAPIRGLDRVAWVEHWSASVIAELDAKGVRTGWAATIPGLGVWIRGKTWVETVDKLIERMTGDY